MPIERTNRYENYLGTYCFNTNCIDFRIQSSKALEKFKNVQAFQLNQLVNGKFYFAQDRREILLLKYDMWFRWLIEIENLFIELAGEKNHKVVNINDMNFIIDLADKTMKLTENIILTTEKERFDGNFTEIWLKIHYFPFKYMKEEIKTIVGDSFDIAFIKIVDILVYIMQYTLIEIYELDSLFCQRIIRCNDCQHKYLCPKNKKEEGHEQIPFIIIGPSANSYKKNIFKFLPVDRLAVYKNYFNIDEIYFKNYTDELIDNTLIDMIGACGIKINFRKCIVK